MTAARLLRSSSLRNALVYGALFIAAVIVVLTFIYLSTVGYMDRQMDTILESDLRGLSRQFESEGEPGLAHTLSERVAQHPDGEVVYLLLDAQGRVLAGNLDEWPSSTIDEDGWIDFLLYEWDFERETRPARALTARLPGDLKLLVGRDVGDRDRVRRLILDALGWALAFTVVLALGIGVLISSRVTDRLEQLNTTARQIMEGDLGRRAPTDGSGDDFDQLAMNLNRMLDRIQSLMTTVQEISNNVAHDLRKPLTRLRHRLEEAQSAAPDLAMPALQQATLEAEELMSTFNSLLRISRIESRSRRSAFVDVDIGALLADVCELYEPTAEESDQHLVVRADPGIVVRGDRDLLFQAVANLVDNAIKYTPAGGEIHLRVVSDSGRARVTVSDTGPGIPAALRDKVFQRFFRVDDSRSTPGNGLGLSLVRAVAELHEAELRLADNSPGLRVELDLERSG